MEKITLTQTMPAPHEQDFPGRVLNAFMSDAFIGWGAPQNFSTLGYRRPTGGGGCIGAIYGGKPAFSAKHPVRSLLIEAGMGLERALEATKLGGYRLNLARDLQSALEGSEQLESFYMYRQLVLEKPGEDAVIEDSRDLMLEIILDEGNRTLNMSSEARDEDYLSQAMELVTESLETPYKAERRPIPNWFGGDVQSKRELAGRLAEAYEFLACSGFYSSLMVQAAEEDLTVVQNGGFVSHQRTPEQLLSLDYEEDEDSIEKAFYYAGLAGSNLGLRFKRESKLREELNKVLRIIEQES